MKINKLIKPAKQKLSILTTAICASALIIGVPLTGYSQGDTMANGFPPLSNSSTPMLNSSNPIMGSTATAATPSAPSKISAKSSQISGDSKAQSVAATGKATVKHSLGDAYSMDFYLNIVDEVYICGKTPDYDGCIDKLNNEINEALIASKTKYKREKITIELVDKTYDKIRFAIEEDIEIPVDELNDMVQDYMNKF